MCQHTREALFENGGAKVKGARVSTRRAVCVIHMARCTRFRQSGHVHVLMSGTPQKKDLFWVLGTPAG
jgi:hypothetical protein